MGERCDHGAAIVSGSQPKINRLSAGVKGHASCTSVAIRDSICTSFKSIKIAMREFCDEDGAELLAWSRNLLYNTPDFVMVGDNKVVNLAMSRRLSRGQWRSQTASRSL